MNDACIDDQNEYYLKLLFDVDIDAIECDDNDDNAIDKVINAVDKMDIIIDCKIKA